MADGLERCLAEMAAHDVDVLLLGRESNARFVSGAARLWLAGTRAFAPSCVVVRSTGRVHLMSNTDVGVPPALPHAQLYPTSWNPVTIMESVASIEGVRAARRVGVDGLTPMWEQLIGAQLPGAELVDGEALAKAARRIKTPAEVDGIRSAIEVAELAFEAAVGALRPGISERELVGTFEARMARAGTSTPAFEGAFCVIDDGSPIRRLSGDRVIVEGDLVAMSAGVISAGWEASLARTWPCGAPRVEHGRRWARWHVRWGELLDRCDAGARVRDLRAVEGARVHGVGLGSEALGDGDELAPGMVVAVELAAEGLLGQDLFHVTASGAETLTRLVYPAFAP